jgi:hypothetical protein
MPISIWRINITSGFIPPSAGIGGSGGGGIPIGIMMTQYLSKSQ